MRYVRRQKNKNPVYGEFPKSFAITMYNVVFMYELNITVVSKTPERVVFDASFDRLNPLRGLSLDVCKHCLLAFTFRE